MKKTFFPKNKWLFSSNKDNIALFLFFYIVWPFGAWVYSLFHAKSKAAYVIFFLFSVLLGWHMSQTNNGLYDDFIGILERFKNLHFSTKDILYQINAYFRFAEDAPKELYENISIWFVKSFTDNYHFFFMLSAIPLAVFQLKSLQRITLDIKFKANYWYAIAIMVMFIFPRDIITVQNPRFTTGLWLGIFSSINYYSDEKKNFLKIIPICLIPMIHSGLWLYAIATVGFVLIPKKLIKLKILEIIALCSIPLAFISNEYFRGIDFSQFLPAYISAWAELNNDDYGYLLKSGAMNSGNWWISFIFAMIMKVAYMIMAVKFIMQNDKVQSNSESKNFYPYYLLIFIMSNVLTSVPVLGERNFWFFQIFTMYMWFKAFYPSNSKLMLMLLFGSSWSFVYRYGYIFGGALSVNTPPDIFFTPLPYLIFKGLLW